MLYVNVSATGLCQNDEFTQNYSHMISFTIKTVNGVQTSLRFLCKSPCSETVAQSPLLANSEYLENAEYR